MTREIVLLLGSPLLFCAPAVAQNALSQDGDTVIAEINGTRLTLAQFEAKRPSALFQARNNYFEAEKKAILTYIDDFLLEQQAQKENLTVPELLDKHVNSSIAKDPDDAALRVYYEGLDTTEPFENVRDKIIEHIREGRRTKAKAAYIESLHSQATISFDVAPPRMAIPLKNASIRGSSDAPVVLIEYADYECPFCQQVQPVLDKLEADFKGRMAFVYKDMPLDALHPHAEKAAEASRCAKMQDKYWEYHDLLFKTKGLEVPQLKAEAAQLGLDTTAFDKCLDSGEQAGAIKSVEDEAMQLGLQSTPAFFLNGRFFLGSLSYDQIRKLIEDELNRVSVQARKGQPAPLK